VGRAFLLLLAILIAPCTGPKGRIEHGDSPLERAGGAKWETFPTIPSAIAISRMDLTSCYRPGQDGALHHHWESMWGV
jgi:hypothetical protein